MYSSKRSLYYYYYFIYLLAFNGVVVAYLDYNPGESLTELSFSLVTSAAPLMLELFRKVHLSE